MFRYEVGDIVGVAPAWNEAVLLELMSPYVHAFHHLLVGPSVPEDEDWIILESIGSGVRVGRLSWYRGQQIIVYRMPYKKITDIINANLIFDRATLYGRRGYDYLGLLQLAIWGIPKWIKGGFKPIPFDEIPSDHNSALICTELVVEAYEKVYRLVLEGVAATPAAIKAAQLSGLLEVVYEGPVAAGIVKISLLRQRLYRYLHSRSFRVPKLPTMKLGNLAVVVVAKTGKAVRDLSRQVNQVWHRSRFGSKKKP